MAEARVEFDESRFPLVVLTLRGSLTDQDYLHLFERSETLLRRQQRHVMVVDLRQVTSVADAKRRQQLANWTHEMEQKYGQLSLGSVMIVQSALVRGALTALNWLREAAPDEVWVNNMAQALTEARARLTKAGLELPAPPLDRALP